MLGYVYYRNAVDKGKIPNNLDEALKVGTSAGAIIGQVLFGFLCDKLGRKKVSYFDFLTIFKLMIDVWSITSNYDLHHSGHCIVGDWTFNTCNWNNRYVACSSWHRYWRRLPDVRCNNL